MKDIDLNLLIVLDAVMIERNLRRAGERLHRTQPAVSQAISRLRHITGDPLFERSPAGVEPTPRAEQLWRDIRGPLEQLRRALLPVQFNPAELTGEMVLGLADDARILLWPTLAATLLKAAPQATLRSTDTNHTKVWQDSQQSRFDLALSVAGQPPAGFTAKILHHDEFVLLLRKDRPAPTTAKVYAACPQLAVVFGEEQPAYADEALNAVNMQRHVVARVTRFDAMPELVRELNAVAALPRLIAQHFAARDKTLTTARLPLRFPPAILKMCWHEKHRFDPMQCWLRDITEQSVTQQIKRLL